MLQRMRLSHSGFVPMVGSEGHLDPLLIGLGGEVHVGRYAQRYSILGRVEVPLEHLRRVWQLAEEQLSPGDRYSYVIGEMLGSRENAVVVPWEELIHVWELA